MSDVDAAGRRKFAVQIVCILLAIPFLYALSSGPVLMLAARNDQHHTKFGHAVVYYRPLLRAATLTYLDQPLSRYLRFWGIGRVVVPWKTTRADPMDIFPLQSGPF
jgi:hypothetical protein